MVANNRTGGHPRRALGAVGMALSLALLFGCAGPADLKGPTPGSANPAPPGWSAVVAALAPSLPTRLLIPSIDVDAGLMGLGLQPDGSLEVPPDGATAGWYTGAPTPGEIGPAVLVAHVDWKGAKGGVLRVGQ